MKKVYSFCLLTLIGLGFVTPANAAPISSEMDATFTPKTGDIQMIKPGTDEKIDIVDGNTAHVTVGNVQLMHVPDFRFGSNETDVNTKKYDAIYEHYVKTGESEKFSIPHFIQVGDVSGVEGTKWKIEVEQVAPFQVQETEGHVLANTRIQLYNHTLTNNVRNSSVASMVTGLVIPAESSVEVPVKGKQGAISVLASKGGTGDSSTNGTITSTVFDKEYDAANYGAVSSPELTAKNQNVKLNVPQSDGVQAKKYTATLEWSLTIEP